MLAGVGDDARLGREQVGGGVKVRCGDRVDARAVAAAQRGGGVDVLLGAGERRRSAGQDLVDQEADDPVDVAGGNVDAADPTLCLGLDVPALPIGAVRLERLLDGGGGFADPRGIDASGGSRDRVQRLVQHRLHARFAAKDLARLGRPGGALLGEAARLVLALPGLEGRLLGQLHGLHG